jgi:MarR family 2-MHQ and catechol resistance regulon transcriptional repressor
MALRDAGPEGLPLGEIGRRLVVTKANVTGLVDRLERDGLVQRDAHADRRVTMARLTAKGLDLLEAAPPRHRELLAAVLGRLKSEDKEMLISLLTQVRRGVREIQMTERN